MRAPRRLGLLLLGLVASAWAPLADSAYSDDAVKAAFLYRFTGFVDWPEASLLRDEFTVAVLGSRPVARELSRLLARYPVKSLPARVRTIDDPAQARDAQVLYVGPGYAGELEEIVTALGRQPVLLVTDRPGALEQGSAVNFLVVDRRVRCEVSVGAAQRAGLKVSSLLLAVVARVRRALMPLPHRPCPPKSPPADSFDRACRVRVASL